MAHASISDALAFRTEVTDGCWNWTGCIQSNGYGRLTFGRKTDGVHRWAFKATGYEIPDGTDICHTCDNRRCVRPSHLFVGTRLDNMRDCKAKGRTAGPTKLTWEQVREIRAAEPSWKMTRGMADRFGVTISNIRHVLNGKTWKEAA